MQVLVGKADEINRTAKVLLLCFLFVVCYLPAASQYFVRGMVVDDESDLPVAGATIKISGSASYTGTDETGWFTIRLSRESFLDSLPMQDREVLVQISAMGYEDMELVTRISSIEVVPLSIRLIKAARLLQEVVVSPRYSSRNNPAVDLIRQVTAHRSANQISAKPPVRFQAYNKIVMAVSDLPKGLINNPLFRSYNFIFENTDTISSPGRTLTPLYIEEKLSTEFRDHRSNVSNSQVHATRHTELDERFVNNENFQAIVSFLHADMNLYDNNLILFNRSFMTPVASGSPLFYKYAIRDTVIKDDRAYIRVDFLPRNERERLFSGNILISTDGRYAIREAFLQISHGANINWINDMEIHFNYQHHDSGMYLPDYIETDINFGVFGSRQGFFSRWIQHYDQYDFDPGDRNASISNQPADTAESVLSIKSEHYWKQHRPLKLTEVEAQLYQNIDSLNHHSTFLKTLEWAAFLATSYKRVGVVELGPLEYVYSYNDLEGSRVRLGGRISRAVSERFFAEAYTAYGFNDQRWKYYGLLAVGLNNRPIAQYPAHFLSVSYQNDVREPGLPLDFLNGDGIFKSFGRNRQNRWLYHQLAKLQHSIEFGDHWRLRTTLSTRRQETAGTLHFIRAADHSEVPAIQSAEAVVELRWAPGEEFFQSNLRRTPVPGNYPVFNFRYNAGLSGFLGGQYDYHAVRFDVSKRIYMSFLGFSELEFGTGYIFGVLPYPLLEIPMADQSYLMSPDTYRLMNNLEFVSDRFVKFNIYHRFQGFFISKIPFLRNTKIRETIGAKVYFGQLRAENNPLHNPNLFYFPVDQEGQQSSFSLGRTPYVEASVGLENIFNFLHIEYIKRLSYLDLPEARRDGFRFSIRLGF